MNGIPGESQEIVEAVISAIDKLMRQSYWAGDQTPDSLMSALREELNEFRRSLLVGDRVNVHFEAADVLMLLLCAVRLRFPDASSDSLGTILSAIVDKLHRRFSHLYMASKHKQLTLFDAEDGKDGGRVKEDRIWEQSKRAETLQQFSFCPKPACIMYAKINRNNMIHISPRKFKCTACYETFFIHECILFPTRNTNRGQIADSIASVFQPKGTNFEASVPNYVPPPKNVRARLLSTLSKEDALSNLLEVRYGILPSESTHLFNDVMRQETFQIQESYADSSHWHARRWDTQQAVRYVMKTNKGRLVEGMVVFHYAGANLADLTVEISNMHGCPLRCLFCASRDVKPLANLEPLDYVRQVNTCLTAHNIQPNQYEKFYVSFAGIGEPSIVAEQVAQGAQWVQRLYPHVKYNIATFGIRLEAFEIWHRSALPLRTIQLPFLHYRGDILLKLVPGLSGYVFRDAISKAIILAGQSNGCCVKINYILMQGINDSAADVRRFINMVSEFRDSITVKLSFLNPTVPGKRAGLKSPPLSGFKKALRMLLDRDFDAYIFGTEHNCLLGCGQLVGGEHRTDQDS